MPKPGSCTILPLCAICCDTLGQYGGPATLPCGHNGCLDCLTAVHARAAKQGASQALCPLCRAPFDGPLGPNTELRDLISLATSIMMDEEERQDGWEAFPDRSATAEEYASDLKLGRAWSDASAPSAPSIPTPPGQDAVEKHRQVMQLPPPQWLPDSLAACCGACHKAFRPLTRLRHHCRCCGRIFCHACSSQRALLPPKFNSRVPERVCDTCAAMLAPLQPFLAGTQATAAQPPVHDAVLDGVSLRSWVNLPYSSSLEQDVFKAANILAKFTQVSRLQPEQGLPGAVLGGVHGLVLVSLVKVGAGWSATFGTGVVVSRNSAGQWSAPCAVAVAGVGWGLQVGGELTDLLLVLRTPEAVRACCGVLHLGLGGSVGVALGPLGRSADAAIMVGSAALTTQATAVAYSCSQGAFLGASLEGSVLTVRDSVNHAFYGMPVTPRALLVERHIGPPPAAAALYDALHALMRKYEVRQPAWAATPMCTPARLLPDRQPEPQPAVIGAMASQGRAAIMDVTPSSADSAGSAGWASSDYGLPGSAPTASDGFQRGAWMAPDAGLAGAWPLPAPVLGASNRRPAAPSGRPAPTVVEAEDDEEPNYMSALFD